MTNTQIRYVSAEEMAFHAARARELRAEAMQAFFAGLFRLFRPVPAARIRATALVTAK
jgi:hypothetical protein